MFGKLIKSFKKSNKLSSEIEHDLKISSDISKQYISRAYDVISGKDNRNTVGGMLRGSTLSLEKFEHIIDIKELAGHDMSKYKSTALDIRKQLNEPFLREQLALEKSCYEQELIDEGYLEKM